MIATWLPVFRRSTVPSDEPLPSCTRTSSTSIRGPCLGEGLPWLVRAPIAYGTVIPTKATNIAELTRAHTLVRFVTLGLFEDLCDLVIKSAIKKSCEQTAGSQ